MTGRDIRDTFGSNLKRYRQLKGLSQLSLATDVDLAHNFINDIEKGKKWVSPETIALLAEALNVEPFRLFMPESKESISEAEMIKAYLDDINLAVNSALAEIAKRYIER